MNTCSKCGREIQSTRAKFCADCRHDVRSETAKVVNATPHPCKCGSKHHVYKFMIVKGGWRGRPVAGGRTR